MTEGRDSSEFRGVAPVGNLRETCGLCGKDFDPGKGAIVGGRHKGTGKLMFVCCAPGAKSHPVVATVGTDATGEVTVVSVTRPDSTPVMLLVDGRHVTTVEWRNEPAVPEPPPEPERCTGLDRRVAPSMQCVREAGHSGEGPGSHEWSQAGEAHWKKLKIAKKLSWDAGNDGGTGGRK